MHTEIITLAKDIFSDKAPETVLSFRPFIGHLKKRKEDQNNHKAGFFTYIIAEFEKHPELLQQVDLEGMSRYQHVLELIYNCLSPIIEDEEKQFWALCQPLTPYVFYSTNAFYNLVISISTGMLRKAVAEKSPEELREDQLKFCYSVILEKCYHLPAFFKTEAVHSLEDEDTGLMHYYKMKMDTRFIEVHPKTDFPDFNIKLLQSGENYDHSDMIPLLRKWLPLDMFRFEGFAIETVVDVTAQYAYENIRNSILNRGSLENKQCLFSIHHWLKTIVASNDIEFGLMPVLKIDNKLIFEESTCSNGLLVNASREFADTESAYISLVENYLKEPKRIFWNGMSKEDETKSAYIKILANKGVKSYAIIPLYYNSAVVGMVEIYTSKPNLLTEGVLSLLDPVIPMLSQVLKNTIDEFHEEINQVIREKFTSVQPSVQWKFNQTAWHYLRDTELLGKTTDIGEIAFENVYPLYGAVDIRNSTIERNAALATDFKVQFNVLKSALNEIKLETGFALIDEKIFLVKKWISIINGPSGGNQEIKLNDFFENQMHPFLRLLEKGNPKVKESVGKYFDAIDEKTGVAYESRRNLETSMNTVISAVNNYLETMKGEVQQAYPSYFEKFRTDGVEYDIYIGQSIAPDKPFSDIYLKNLRLLQLTSMAAIAKLSHALLEHLSKPVETTQLIFIHSHPINIMFRNDEKRFDVEGAYNIRYHVIKKRIDKVRIKGTKERLTQPNKIAIVYFSQKEADEQIGYIRYLQEQNMLNNDLEELELEDLQGVIGLKALRVGVTIDEGVGSRELHKLFNPDDADTLKVG
ncbi:MAG: GAF domain-containing protein [Chitinophagaceae bacterium]|nr:GAF domain-containing protein [Chitinophagaceae bacterium]